MLILALTNAITHDPHIGYDADDYAAYIESLASGRLPSKGDNDEFFTPPLPFVIPALLHAAFNFQISVTLKIAQFINVLLALGTALALARICNRLTGGSDICRNLALAFLLTLPVFYKTNAFVRAEPYLVFFILLYFEQLTRLVKEQTKPYTFAIKSGILFGAVLLSRQWGILVLPAIFLFALQLIWRAQDHRREFILGFVISGMIAFVLSGWFYLSLLDRYGSVTAFNRESFSRFRLKNKPASFYIGTGNGLLFSDPIRDSFDNQIIPILYSETWGDYWGYYYVYGRDLRNNEYIQGGLLQLAIEKEDSRIWLETNRFEVAPYLGRVNLISLLPTGIAILSVGWALVFLIRSGTKEKASGLILITLSISMIMSTLIGYLWFLIQYPSTDGDTIKATYVLQIFPLIALLIGLFGSRISRLKKLAYPSLMTLFLLLFIHNLPAMISNFTP